MDIDEDDTTDICIPPEVLRTLPHKSLSILDLIHFHLIPQSESSLSFTNADEWFDNSPPTANNEAVLQLSVPSPAFVQELEKALPHATQVGRQSIKSSPNTKTTYPLWAVPFWSAVTRVHAVQKLWIEARSSLLTMRLGKENDADFESAKIIDDVLVALGTLPWDEDLKGFGRNGTEKIHWLVLYISNEWLKGEHANQMLDLLKLDLAQHQIPSTEITSSYFYEKISHGFRHKEDYTSNVSFRVYRDMGNKLASGKLDRVAFLANLDRNHWVAVVLDFRQKSIWFGDSLGGKCSAEVEAVLKWWIKFHSEDNFTLLRLPITIQNDFFSCCLLAWNALVAFFFKETEDLIPASDVAWGRLRVLLRVIRRHQSEAKLCKIPIDVSYGLEAGEATQTNALDLDGSEINTTDPDIDHTDGGFPRFPRQSASFSNFQPSQVLCSSISFDPHKPNTGSVALKSDHPVSPLVINLKNQIEALFLRLNQSEECFEEVTTTLELALVEQGIAALTITRIELEVKALKNPTSLKTSSDRGTQADFADMDSIGTSEIVALTKQYQDLVKAKNEGHRRLTTKVEELRKNSVRILELKAQVKALSNQTSTNYDHFSHQLSLILRLEPETPLTTRVRAVQQSFARLARATY